MSRFQQLSLLASDCVQPALTVAGIAGLALIINCYPKSNPVRLVHILQMLLRKSKKGLVIDNSGRATELLPLIGWPREFGTAINQSLRSGQ